MQWDGFEVCLSRHSGGKSFAVGVRHGHMLESRKQNDGKYPARVASVLRFSCESNAVSKPHMRETRKRPTNSAEKKRCPSVKM